MPGQGDDGNVLGDKFKDTDLQKGVDRLNKLLAKYGRRIDLSDPPKAK
jgi:hypothetical protein